MAYYFSVVEIIRKINQKNMSSSLEEYTLEISIIKKNGEFSLVIDSELCIFLNSYLIFLS